MKNFNFTQSYAELEDDYEHGNLHIYGQFLSSLDGCPDHVTGYFSCRSNALTSLVGGPERVDCSYACYDNKLTDLVGCASHIGGKLNCEKNNITSLVGIHDIIKSCKSFSFDSRKIKQGGIGLLLIDDLTEITSHFTKLSKPFEIIKSYLGTGSNGMNACSKELINAGYTNHAIL